MIGAKLFGHDRLVPDGRIEHVAKCRTINRSGMHAKADNPSRVLVHNDRDPMSPARCRFAATKMDAPEAVLQMTQEG